MEKVLEAKTKAIKSITIADHILTQSYPLLKDSKLLIAVLENIFLSLTNTMGAILYFEREMRRIPPFHENFDSKFNMFKMKVARRQGISNDTLQFILDVKTLLASNKKSPIGFSRKGAFVIASDNYDLQSVSEDMLKKHVKNTKVFIQQMNNIIKEHEGLSR